MTRNRGKRETKLGRERWTRRAQRLNTKERKKMKEEDNNGGNSKRRRWRRHGKMKMEGEEGDPNLKSKERKEIPLAMVV